jgi:3-oxoadipate enol-lactonase
VLIAMPFANISGAQIHYQLDGIPGAPVLLFSNSLGTTLEMWDPQLVDFAKHFRVLRYDTRGHGQSSVTPGPYSIEQLASDVVHLLELLEIQQVQFCGLSMGGLTGMLLGAGASTRIGKLILCSTAARIGTAEIWNTRIKTIQESGIKSISNAGIERWLSAAFRASHPAETAALREMLEGANPEGYLANCAAVRDADLRATILNIQIPTLVVSGTEDPVTPPADGRFLTEQIPGARYIELQAAHICNLEAQRDFNREVLSFLQS